MEKSSNYFSNRAKSFVYAIKGIFYLFRYGKNAQIHLLAAVGVISAGIYFDIAKYEWCFVFLAIAMVVGAEALNTAIEKLTDSIYKEKHVEAGHIKDLAAAAVLVCAVFALVVGVYIFTPYVESLFW